MKSINYQCYTNNRTGYSIVGVNIGIQLSKMGITQSLLPFDNPSQDEEVIQWVNQSYFLNNLPIKNAPLLSIQHEHSLHNHISRPYYGFPIFEMDNFSSPTKNSLGWPNHLIVCTEWAKSVIVNLGIKQKENVSVCPLGVNPSIFSPRPIPQDKTDKYIFMNVGKLSMNKGHHLLPMMFNKAFTEADNVELWMSSHNPFLSASELKEWLKLYKDSPLGHKIRFLPEVASQRDLADLMNQADCGIFPALCEGWNLGLLEMMSMSKPVVATNYSGHTGFCTNKNAYLVSPNDVESANDNKWFFGTGNWAKITNKEIDEFVDHLRYCYKERPNNEEGVKTGEKLTWRNSAEIISRIMLG